MKNQKQLIPIILFVLAGIIFILGIVQLALYIPQEINMVKDAVLQGATSEQISEYYLQQFIPQIITFVITSLGIASLLFASGCIYKKLSQTLSYSFNSTADHAINKQALVLEESKEISDDFFEEFQVQEQERK